MTYLFIALVCVVYIGLFSLCCFALFEWNQPIPAVVGIVLLLAGLFWLADSIDKNSKPSAKYETRMMYNAATKTMMPAEFCAQEGTWVK